MSEGRAENTTKSEHGSSDLDIWTEVYSIGTTIVERFASFVFPAIDRMSLQEVNQNSAGAGMTR